MDDSLDAVWRALADPTRRGLLDGLRYGPRSTGELAALVPTLTRFAVMKHLGVLESAGLITSERRGRRKLNHLNAVPLRRVYERWVSRYEDAWAGSLDRLRNAAESPQHRGDTTMNATKLLETPARLAVIRSEITVKAEPAAVYNTVLNRPAEWFNNGPDAGWKAVIEPKLGGRFYLLSDNGDENLMAFITMLKPDRKIRMKGDFTMPEAVVSNATMSFEPIGTGTRVTVDHRMVGEFTDETPTEFEAGWLDGLEKLRGLFE
ncbi:MAG: SRPBCC domain-containing protein [Planctomycetota bacterium]